MAGCSTSKGSLSLPETTAQPCFLGSCDEDTAAAPAVHHVPARPAGVFAGLSKRVERLSGRGPLLLEFIHNCSNLVSDCYRTRFDGL